MSAPDNTNPPASLQPASGTIPRLIKFSGVVKDLTGKVSTGVVGLTFSLYELPEGGNPLWTETQSLSLDAMGRYMALLGANSPEGLPLDLFTSGKALWVGVQPQLPGEAEQPRVLLVAVPYSLKSSDADTLGGLPASAYMLAPSANTAQGSSVTPLIALPPPCVDSTTAGPSAVGLPCPVTPAPTPSASITGGGAANFAAMFTGASTIGNSAIYNSLGGWVGIGTTNPAATLDVHGTGNFGGALNGTTASFSGALTAAGIALPATGTATTTQGVNSNPFDLIASSFNSGTSAAVPQLFRWQAEPAANNTASPSGTLNLLYLVGSGTPAETGLSIASTGQINFASGQTFPGTGTGTVTSVGSGAGLTGGPITTSGALSIATGGVTNTMLANPSLTVTAGTGLSGGGSVALGGSVTLNNTGTLGVGVGAGLTSTGGQTPTLAINTSVAPTLAASSNVFTGSITASSFPGNGANVTNVNAASLNGLLSSAFQPAGSYAITTGANTFAATQTISSGNLGLSNGNLALPDTNGAGTAGVVTIAGNPFLHDCCGAANQNGFIGRAGNFTTTGTNITASGFQALSSNTTGNTNTASGVGALSANTTGSGNTAFGFSAGHYFNGTTFLPATGANSTFVGANATATMDGLSNATAIGYGAQVGESNALVLGNGASVGIGTSTPLYTLDVHGTGNFTGPVTFASGQTFPGVGTVTSVASGAGLTGGPISTSGTLSIATGGVTNSMLANSSLSVPPGTDLVGGGSVQLGGSVTLNLDTTKVPTLGASSNVFTGSITASSFSGSGANLTGLTPANISAGTAGINISGNAATATSATSAGQLGGVAAANFARLDIANSFTGNQSVTGNVTATGAVSAGAGTFSGTVSATGAQLPTTGTATSSQGYPSNPLDWLASSFNSGTSAAVSQLFRWKAEPAGNNTPSPSGTLNLLYLAGTGTPAETGLSISSNGRVNFASGQTFPGTGTVTSVASGSGLTGGPITGTGTLSIATGGVTNAMLANPSLTVLAGTGLTGGGSVALGNSVTLNNAGTLGVVAGLGLTSTGGQTPTLAINTNTVPQLRVYAKITIHP